MSWLTSPTTTANPGVRTSVPALKTTGAALQGLSVGTQTEFLLDAMARAFEGLRPFISTHVRWCERGAPVQG